MNIFEKDAMEHDEPRQMRAILSAWGSFKAILLQLMESYKAVNPEGQRHGADISEPNSTSIVIVCPRGAHPKQQFTSLMITIRAGVEQRSKFAIVCEIEQWRKRPVPSIPPQTDWTKKLNFALDTDNDSLIYQNEQLTPAEAAERLLEIALLGL